MDGTWSGSLRVPCETAKKRRKQPGKCPGRPLLLNVTKELEGSVISGDKTAAILILTADNLWCETYLCHPDRGMRSIPLNTAGWPLLTGTVLLFQSCTPHRPGVKPQLECWYRGTFSTAPGRAPRWVNCHTPLTTGCAPRCSTLDWQYCSLFSACHATWLLEV